jgi:predicted nucleic acid-binding protein
VIILDTNVISELMEVQPNRLVLAWFDDQDGDELWTTSISLAELLVDINRLPDGRRRRELDSSLARVLASAFQERFLAFDQYAAREYGTLVPARRAQGHPISAPDAQIAAIATSRGATLATRNVKDFLDTGIDVVNPWDESPATTGA